MAYRSPLGADPFAALTAPKDGPAIPSRSKKASPAVGVKAVRTARGKPKKSSSAPATPPRSAANTVPQGPFAELNRTPESGPRKAESLRQAVADGLRIGSESRREQAQLKSAMDGYRQQWENLMERVESLPLPQPRRRERDGLLSKLADVRELFRPEKYLDFWFEFVLASRSENIDAFGLDPIFEARVENLLSFLFYRWWRIEVKGVENIPSEGRALLVSNHSGVLPYDGAMIKLAVKLQHPAQRRVRFLVENFVYYFPFLGPFMYRFGSVRASQENATRLLNSDELVAVFPEGVKGLGKLYRQRYQLQRFGRGGFVRLAEGTGSPIIPVAVIGAEEIHPVVARSPFLARQLGVPYFPITFTFPALGLFGLIPLPTRWTIRFGELFAVQRPERESEDIWVNGTSLAVRKMIQELIYDELRLRRSIFIG